MGLGGRDEENPEELPDVEAEKQSLKPKPAAEEMELKKIEVKTYPDVIIGRNDPIVKVHHLKYILLGFNCFLMILGLALLAISVWIRVDPEFWEYETTLDIDNFHAVCAMMIVASVIILIIGLVGSFGAATERRWLLISYIVIFGLIVLLELAAVIIMWSAPYSKTITKEIEKQIQHQIDERDNDDSSRYFMDFIQTHLECCGSISVKDYGENFAPNSCMNERSGIINSMGCSSKLLTYLRTKAGIVGGIALPILLVQILALLAAGSLIKSLNFESKYFM